MQQELFNNPELEALIERRKTLLGESWYAKLGEQFDMGYMKRISLYLTERREKVLVYPAPENVFRAYQLTPFEETKVVIIAQDPYHDGTATGVAMGVKDPKIYPKTIDILDTAIEEDAYDGMRFPPIDPDLEYLSKQGVLLLNSSLTVEHGNAGSHANVGWSRFIEATINSLNDKDFVVYLLWGSHAQGYKKFVADKHTVLEAEHPNKHRYDGRTKWEHRRPFSKTNVLLENNGLRPIYW